MNFVKNDKLFFARYTGGRDGIVHGIERYGFSKPLIEETRAMFYKHIRGLYDIQFWSVYDPVQEIGARYIPCKNAIVATTVYLFHAWYSGKNIELMYDVPVALPKTGVIINEATFFPEKIQRKNIYDKAVFYGGMIHESIMKHVPYESAISGMPKIGRLLCYMMYKNYCYQLYLTGAAKKIDNTGRPIFG